MMLTNPKDIEIFRLMTLRKGLYIEIKGMKKRGKSSYQIIKDEFDFKGNKINVYNKFTDYINEFMTKIPNLNKVPQHTKPLQLIETRKDKIQEK